MCWEPDSLSLVSRKKNALLTYTKWISVDLIFKNVFLAEKSGEGDGSFK